MALFTHTSLEIVLLLCFAFNLNICRVNKNIVNDPAVVWLLQPSASVETVSSDESSTSSSETEADDRIDRPIGPHRFNNRLPVPHHARPYKPSVSDQRNVPTKPKWKNPADGGQHGATGDQSKKPPNNEIHIEVDNLDQIGDFLKNLLNSDDVDVEINSAPGTPGVNPSLGKKPDVSSGVNSKWRPSASPHSPRPYTTTERTFIRTLTPAGRRPYTTSPRPPSFKSRYSPTTKYPHENFWLPPTTMPTEQNFFRFTPRDADKQTTASPEATGHGPTLTSTATNQGENFSQSPWEWFKDPFWGPPLTSTSPFPAATTQPTTFKSNWKIRPSSHDGPLDDEDELDEENSEEVDDEDNENDAEILNSRQLDEGKVPLGSSDPTVATAPVVTRNDNYGVQPYQAPATSYYTSPSPLRLDFSPLFLALIPIALFLGAAASFALSSAVTSNTAVASAQQQQQQQEANNNNANNANNNNANTVLSLLTALYQNNNNNAANNFPFFLIVNDTSVIGRRRRRRVKRLIELLD